MDAARFETKMNDLVESGALKDYKIKTCEDNFYGKTYEELELFFPNGKKLVMYSHMDINQNTLIQIC